MKPFRVIDTGVREGRAQIAFDQALIELHKEGGVPDTIRFLRFPPTALIGRHQALARELKLDYCRANGVGTARRITGGGAIYLDPGQLGWELVFSRASLALGTLEDYAKAICEALAAGLSEGFGIEARFRPRNDIEVEGRKLCGTGGFFDGDTMIYQGTVLVDLDPARMVACLNVPEAKLQKRALDRAEQRVVTLKELLAGETPEITSVMQAVLQGFSAGLGIELHHAVPSDREEALAARHYTEKIGTDAFVHEIDEPAGSDLHSASQTGPGGTVSAHVRLDGAKGTRIREVLITGDFFVTPPRLIYDLEASLRGTPSAEAGPAVDRFFAAQKPDLLTITPGDFRAAIEAAIGQRDGHK
jgi:lipoate-protein ligase A